MIKYHWTTFQLLALVSFTLAICDLVSFSQMNRDPGLGGLAPYIYLAFSVGVFILDVFMQAILGRHKRVFYISQVLLCLAFVVWLYTIGEF